MVSTLRRVSLLAAFALTSCSFHSLATRWNGRVGADGTPVHIRVTTNVGFNLFVILPFLGNTTIGTMIDESTRLIAATNSDQLRVIETRTEVYWYGFPPFTWLVTPVVTDVAVEYRPSDLELGELTGLAPSVAEPPPDPDHGPVAPEPRR
jgi:hypothetical protein